MNIQSEYYKQDGTDKYYTRYIQSLIRGGTTSSSCWARSLYSLSFNSSVSVAQVTGCLPLPSSHIFIISVQHPMGSRGYFSAMVSRICPCPSKSKWIPNFFHSEAMVLIISTLCPQEDFRRVSCMMVGFISVYT